MDFTNLVFITAILGYVGVTIYIANVVEVFRYQRINSSILRAAPHVVPEPREVRILRWLLYGLAVMTFAVGVVVLQAGFLSGIASDQNTQFQDVALPNISAPAAVFTFIVAAAASLISYRLITSEAARQQLQRLVGRWGDFKPESSVHVTASVLMLVISVYAVSSFVLQGGISGFAEQIETSGIGAGDVIFQAVLQVVVTLLGVGLAIRRTAQQTLERLALRLPTSGDIAWGVGVGILFIMMLGVFGSVWEALTSPEQLAEQTAAAEQISRAFSTLPLAFIMASSAAIGEEIWIRGALQPVFGIPISSIFFMLLHTQYTLTPATLIILILSLGLGWLRQRQSTTAAIIAHFVFNFVPLALAVLVSN
jgi:membrane protease YdiL (CAAX protease family)